MRTAAQAFKARVSLVATVLIAAATLGSVVAQSHPPKPPKTVRLYVFDCGVIYHGDHVANANEFAGSTWLVRKVERDAMFAEKPPAIATPKTYDKLKNSKTILLTTDEYDVFGDGNVIIKSAPGHTPGHQVLIVKLAHTGNVMLSGDLYHYPEERKLNRVPSFEYNAQQTLASRAMIEA
ncbi:MAG: MBL fold metallo-hydrolase, partial [Candidatus Acidiferrales bacterium]